MKLYDLLKEYGMFANELRKRLQSNQILVNGEPQKGDYDMGNVTDVYDQGFFLEELYDMPNYDKWSGQIMFFGISNLLNGESNIQNEMTEFLKKYKMIQISKEVGVFVKTTDAPSDEIKFHKETGHSTSKVEAPKEVDQSDQIEKMKSDRDKIKKQLSNPGFVNNAPKFKVEAAEKRLNDLTTKLSDLGVNENNVTRFKDFN